MTPEAISSYRTNPGRIGKPAASADVQELGRNASEFRLQTAPLPAFQLPLLCG